jgi:hypothetical protein
VSGACILGIDPGLDGALALYDPLDRSLEVMDMPVFQLKTKRRIDEYALARIVDDWSERTREVWLELVNAMPSFGPKGAGEARRSMGAASAFNFGKGYGLVRGVCAANFLTIIDVTPGAWKAAMKVHGPKDESRQRASVLLPRAADRWPLKKHHGRAEAALIALHGARQIEAYAPQGGDA